MMTMGIMRIQNGSFSTKVPSSIGFIRAGSAGSVAAVTIRATTNAVNSRQ